jgi:hypothetical protein
MDIQVFKEVNMMILKALQDELAKTMREIRKLQEMSAENDDGPKVAAKRREMIAFWEGEAEFLQEMINRFKQRTPPG